MNTKIKIAATETEIRACYSLISELRPHLSENEFVSQILRQIQNHHYELIYLRVNKEIVAAAGYRITEYLAWGKTLYVDDLITRSTTRKCGYGSALLDWLIDKSKALSCQQFHLDSGTHRHDAHRLYLTRKLQINSFHFSNTVATLVRPNYPDSRH